MQYSSNRLCEEVVLLISSARSKNIDISVWLTEDGSDGKVAVPDFNSKLISLGLIVGMGESSVKKSKLDYATSDTSLGRIHILCRAGKDSNGVALIDVSKFLKTCDRMLTSSINDSIVTSLSDYPLSESVESDVAGTSSLIIGELFFLLASNQSNRFIAYRIPWHPRITQERLSR